MLTFNSHRLGRERRQEVTLSSNARVLAPLPIQRPGYSIDSTPADVEASSSEALWRRASEAPDKYLSSCANSFTPIWVLPDQSWGQSLGIGATMVSQQVAL